ncbi:MAG TPA: UbiD family decarboxylase [Xanthobacteraceae bacterium]|nr:UbiD family decarboxylase [Xanthobacteraceae bacterium]
MDPIFRRTFLPPDDLGGFLAHLQTRGQVLAIEEPVSTVLEATEIHRRVIATGGPVLRFSRPIKADGRTSDIPLVVNLFGTAARVAAGFGTGPEQLPALGVFLAGLRQPAPVRGMRDAMGRWPMLRAAFNARPVIVRTPSAQAHVREGADVDLGLLPVQTCWPDEPAPLITWPVVVTRPPDANEPHDYNLGIYRMQMLGRDRAIVRWLPRRGGAQHYGAWAARGEPMPIAVAIGVDPAMLLAAVVPAAEGVSEYLLAGALRGARTRLAPARTVPLLVPADAEIVLEGWVAPGEVAPEGPYGDHTGYYNAVERYPVMRITALTHREAPLYISTFTGRAPDEPSVMAAAMTDVFLPFVRQTLPEVVDCWLPPAACSYRVAVISIRKTYPGQARRIMMGLWSLLPQFLMTKMVIVVDDDVDTRNWSDVIWALSTRMDPARDLTVIADTPMDPLDFASPAAGLAGKLGIDATVKIGPETAREWGRPLAMSAEVIERVERRFGHLFAAGRGAAAAE